MKILRGVARNMAPATARETCKRCVSTCARYAYSAFSTNWLLMIVSRIPTAIQATVILRCRMGAPCFDGILVAFSCLRAQPFPIQQHVIRSCPFPYKRSIFFSCFYEFRNGRLHFPLTTKRRAVGIYVPASVGVRWCPLVYVVQGAILLVRTILPPCRRRSKMLPPRQQRLLAIRLRNLRAKPSVPKTRMG